MLSLFIRRAVSIVKLNGDKSGKYFKPDASMEGGLPPDTDTHHISVYRIYGETDNIWKLSSSLSLLASQKFRFHHAKMQIT